MGSIKKHIVLIIIVSFIGSLTLHAMEETATKTASITLEAVIGETVKGLSVAGPYVSVAYQSLVISKEIKAHVFPNDEEAKHAHAVATKYSFLVTERELEKCLLQHRNSSERGRSGRPLACEDIARMLILLDGKEQVNKMTTIYNQFRK